VSDFLSRIEKLSPKRLALLAYELQSRLDKAESERDDPIAIIGLGCRFPGAPDPEAYWKLLEEGRDAISEVPADRWDIDEFYDPDPDAPGRMATRWGGFLDRVDGFDAPFFGISRREAVSMDPQQRLLLEVAWEALENAGQSPRALAGSATGVFVGMSTGDYYGLLRSRGLESVDAYMATGTAHSVAAGRVAYVLGLHGPNLAIDTACSSSLVAIHLACQSLRARECKVALAGGVNLILAPDITVALSKSHMMAPDGRCKAFDASANGFVRGEGCGVIVLKRLSDARADGDTVLAVIRGSAMNQDGRSSGITAPNGASQRQVIRAALAAARVAPADVGYIESHGTGTSLGDPIEAHALAAEFSERGADNPLTIGSVKANIGHLEASAGVAGLIKVVLSLQHGRIPTQLHFHEMNPHIEWGSTSVDIPVGGRDWQTGDKSRIAGVSSFGFSGTNAHIVLEEAPAIVRESVAAAEAPNVLALSARTSDGLRDLIDSYATTPFDAKATLADVCFTAGVGRSHFAERAAFIANTLDELRTALSKGSAIRGSAEVRPKIAFLFTGQGSQSHGMGRELYDSEPVFRAAMDECARILAGQLERPLLDVIYGDGGALLDETQYTQPALFALEWSLAQLWKSSGVEPSAVLGHSVGEYAALCVAGLWTLEDGLKVIAQRGKLMQKLGAGWGMTAVQCSMAQTEEALRSTGGQLSIAAVNAPESIVVSGAIADLARLEDSLTASGVQAKRLRVSHGFHSAQMDQVAREFSSFMGAIEFHAPRVAVISSVTGQPLGLQELRDQRYWQRQVRESVRFQAAMETLAASHELFLEIGPSVTLLGLGRQSIEREGQSWVASLRRDRGDNQQMLESVGQLYVKGAEIDWSAFNARRKPKRISLPTYPFQRQRYWLEGAGASTGSANVKRVTGHAMLQGRVAAAVPIFQAQLGTELFPYLDDHRVAGAPVLPGAVFLELAMAAASETFGDANIALMDVQLREPLHVSAENHTVQVVISREGHDRGTFQILSSSSSLPDAAWTLHAIGVMRPAAASGTANLAEIRRRVTNPIAPGDFFDVLMGLGIDLGERCRGIHALWTADDEVLAQVSIDPSLESELASYRFHPVLLDACLQTFGAALWQNGESGDTRVLTRIGELNLYSLPPARVWCHATITDRAKGTGSVRILGDDGALIAEATGLETTSIGASSSPESRVQPVDDWFYQLEWIPEPANDQLNVGSVLEGGSLAKLLGARASDLFTEQHLERYQELQPELDALASAYIGRALGLMGCALSPGRNFTTDELARDGKVIENHRSLFSRLLDILGEDDFLRKREENGETRWEVLSTPSANPVQLAESLIQRFPEFAAELALTARCAVELAGVLQGTSDPLQLLFPGGSVDELEGLYTKSPSAHVFNPLVRRAVEEAVASAPAGRVVRILEIGAGTGGTTAFVVPAMPADRVEYTFTDVSPLFLARAEERFGPYPFMRYEVLDIGEASTNPEQYDVVIAANVLHATADLRRTLEHVRQRVAPGGLLVLLEGTRPERWVDLTFGMTEGWWAFDDRELRPDYALVDASTWLRLLAEKDFREVAAIAPQQGAQQVVLVAQASAERAAGSWLILSDSGSFGADLRTHVVQRGGAAVLGDASAISSNHYDHIVYLRGLDLGVETDDSSFSACENTALDVVDVMRSMIGAEEDSKLWIATRGAQSVANEADDIVAMQAALWGIGRTFALENPDAWGGLCDLDPKASNSSAVSSLTDLILNPAGEDQYAIRGDVPHIPRIGRHDVPRAELPIFSPTGKYLITGGLGNIGLRAAEWLVEHGAREIVLNGRTGLPDRDKWDGLGAGSPAFRRVVAVRGLEERGASVSILKADISQPEGRALLREAFSPGELRGILHAAAVFGAHPIDTLGRDDLAMVMRPKMLGAIAVADLARATGADFLVMFSSTTSLLGSSGMAAYAAANQFVDSFAHQLRSDGVQALTVNWGTWDELGDVTEEGRRNYIRAGLYPMPSADALDALGRIIGMRDAQVTIAQIDWTALKSVYQARRRRPILDIVSNRQAAARVETASSAPTDVFATLATLTDSERSRKLVDIIRGEAASVLALGADEVDPQLGLFEMGMDSLMSVELRSRLEKTFARKLPSTLTFNYPNVNALAGYMSGLMTIKTPAATVSSPVTTPEPVVLTNVESDALSEDDIAAMLSDALQSLD
jgi:acyl transferase domain-containing protein/acyl carrier protein